MSWSLFPLIGKGIKLTKGFSTGSTHGLRRLSKEAKGKGIVCPLDMGTFLGPLRFSLSMDIEQNLVLDDMCLDDLGFDWGLDSQVARARAAAKA